ncbi:MAG: hypothetical protein GX447_03425 [Elusimicrobia bacterium]|nr:hypothetical protein [Elusimicrobiota bacterium]
MEIFDLMSKPEYERKARDLNKKGWPKYLLNWECPGWDEIFIYFKKYQVIISEKGELSAAGFTVPLFYQGDLNKIEDDISVLILTALAQNREKVKPNILLAISAVVDEKNKGKGLSSILLKEMKNKAVSEKIKSVILPTRPILKHKYPLIPIEEYCLWKNEKGEAFDPWTRLHFKMGGKIIKTSQSCISIKGSSAQWKEWTELEIPYSGSYIIPGGLSPMRYEKSSDIGIYNMPCVWMEYPL